MKDDVAQEWQWQIATLCRGFAYS